jgi:peptidoglycan/xylan/chitin deacetylase (PgdA/CDA1 family)
MIEIFQQMIFFIIRFTGIPYLIWKFIQKDRVTILLYHDIAVDQAELHLKFLLKKYNIISLKDFIVAHKLGKTNELPQRSLVITIDDGHKNNFNLLPVIRRYNVPFTIFLCTGIVGTNRGFWFHHEIKNGSIEGLKKKQNEERLRILAEQGYQQEKELEFRQALSIDEIKVMNDFVDFQSHGVFHPCLPYCEGDVAEKEIKDSKRELEKLTNKSVTSFSYPNGDYSERDIQLLKKHGYECGITCDLWFNDQNTDLYRLKRLDCRDGASVNELYAKVTGIFPFIKRLIIGQSFGEVFSEVK